MSTTKNGIFGGLVNSNPSATTLIVPAGTTITTDSTAGGMIFHSYSKWAGINTIIGGPLEAPQEMMDRYGFNETEKTFLIGISAGQHGIEYFLVYKWTRGEYN